MGLCRHANQPNNLQHSQRFTSQPYTAAAAPLGQMGDEHLYNIQVMVTDMDGRGAVLTENAD